jgi:hypothetical protein
VGLSSETAPQVSEFNRRGRLLWQTVSGRW